MNPLRTISFLTVTATLLVVFSVHDSHADAPAGQFTDLLNGTVYDTKTKLTWQQVAPPDLRTWNSAQNYCTGLSLAGGGWRVPSMKELQTLLDETITDPWAPTIDTHYFPNAQAGYFWTSSRVAGSASDAWAVFFRNGDTFALATSDIYWVRCVRQN